MTKDPNSFLCAVSGSCPPQMGKVKAATVGGKLSGPGGPAAGAGIRRLWNTEDEYVNWLVWAVNTASAQLSPRHHLSLAHSDLDST